MDRWQFCISEPIVQGEKILSDSNKDLAQHVVGKDGNIFITGNILNTALELRELIKKSSKI